MGRGGCKPALATGEPISLGAAFQRTGRPKDRLLGNWIFRGWGREGGGGAFALPAASRDAALVLRLNPGSYTAQVVGGAGEVLVEVYFID